MGVTKPGRDILEELVEFAKTHNLRVVRVGTVEVEFFEPYKLKAPLTTPIEESVRAPSEDELLFYSTETFDQLREERDHAKD